MSDNREKAILDEIYRSIDAKIENSIQDAPRSRPPRRPPQRPSKKDRKPPWLGMAVCLLLLAGVVFALWKSGQGEPVIAETQPPTEPLPTTGSTVVTVAAGGDEIGRAHV